MPGDGSQFTLQTGTDLWRRLSAIPGSQTFAGHIGQAFVRTLIGRQLEYRPDGPANQWSRARKRYERQGLLVEEAALAQAEQECLADSELRARRQEREVARRAELDRHYVEKFAGQVRELFPGCPVGREVAIAEHACLKYSGRVGRRPLKAWMNTPFDWPWWPTSATSRSTTIRFWPVVTIAGRRAPPWKRQ